MANRLIVLLIVTLVFSSCKHKADKDSEALVIINQPDSCSQIEFEYDDFNIIKLDVSDLPYYDGADTVKEGYLLDVNTVPIHDFKGKKNYHPVYIAQYGLHLIDVYTTTKEPSLIKRLNSISDKMVGLALEVDSSLYMSYSFDFPLHSIKNQTLFSPWYSAMAQGQLLSFYCRLYSITKDPEHLEISHKLFNSFRSIKSKKDAPWITCVDEHKNLWLEEYPMDLPCFTLNGTIFAIYGLYDYYMTTEDPETLVMLKASITTIKNNIKRYRNKGDISYYCLKHQVKSLSYHHIHVGQLETLYKMTGDEYFLEMSNKFKSDTVSK